MKERPILFSAPMVKAILDGRKTQTRRVVKNHPYVINYDIIRDGLNGPIKHGAVQAVYDASKSKQPIRCPYGQPGDRLWVRETWRTDEIYDDFSPATLEVGSPVKYEEGDDATGIVAFGWGRIRQSIFMRRWMSRITLEVVSVRVERLREISGEDAQAEGISPMPHHVGRWISEHQPGICFPSAKSAYKDLWESINGPGSWNTNPYVWVIEFKRIQPATTSCH